jgi:sarcosine oxidase, subunit gamma
MSAESASVLPASLKRRSFIYRLLAEEGARFGEINGGAVALDFGRPLEAELAHARDMALADLSVMAHCGFKGRGTVEWLTAQGLSIGEDSNRAYAQAGGELALRLAPTEILLIDSLDGTGRLMRTLNQAWTWAPMSPRPQQGYPTPRQDTHAWFMVTGRHAPDMFAKICGVDLRRDRFAEKSIAQTSVAKMSATILRADCADNPAYHVLADIASAEYLWTCLVDAMQEFQGRPVGLAALHALGR